MSARNFFFLPSYNKRSKFYWTGDTVNKSSIFFFLFFALLYLPSEKIHLIGGKKKKENNRKNIVNKVTLLQYRYNIRKDKPSVNIKTDQFRDT